MMFVCVCVCLCVCVCVWCVCVCVCVVVCFIAHSRYWVLTNKWICIRYDMGLMAAIKIFLI